MRTDTATDDRRAVTQPQPPHRHERWLWPVSIAWLVSVVILPLVWWTTPVRAVVLMVISLSYIPTIDDLRHRRLTARLTNWTTLLLIAIIAMTIPAYDELRSRWPSAAGAALLGGLIIAGVLAAMHRTSPHQTPAGGDIRLGFAYGIALGLIHPFAAFVATGIGLFLGGGVGQYWMRRHPNAGGYAFAPALSAGTIVTLIIWPLIGGPTTW